MLNNSFEELERKYKKYQRKLFFKKFFRFFSIIGIVAVAFFLYFLKWDEVKEFILSKISENKQSDKNATRSIKPPPTPSLSLSPKIEVDKLKKFVDKSDKKEIKVKNLPKTETLPKEIYARDSKKLSKKGNIKEVKIKDEKTLKKEFILYNDYKSAISLAELFFEQKKYKKAIKWAIRASRYNPGADEPWLIYAKAKKSEGQIRLAIKALKTYLRSHKSKKVEKLLKKYEREGKKR